MNYIVFDLEWNQCPYGKERENPRLPFEIVEIGALKLNNEKETLDEFHRLIHPTVYRKMHYRTKQILDMDMEQLEKGDYFGKAVKDFLQWCAADGDYRFCTWGGTDLVELQRNMKYYGKLGLIEGPIPYYDVQKLFSLDFEDGKSRKSLEYGIDFLHIKKERNFHHALDDAFYTAEILKRLDQDLVERRFSIDCYQNPKERKDQIRVVFDDYEKFISREFDSKEEAMKDKDVTQSRCFLCGKNVRKKIRWFSGNSKNYYCLAYCPVHGYLKGKARMKKTDEGGIYVVKTIKLIDETGAERIREKRKGLKVKRKQKKVHKKNEINREK